MSRYQTFLSRQFAEPVLLPVRHSGHDPSESTGRLPVAQFGQVPILPPGQPLQAQGEHDTDLPGPETRRIAGHGLRSASSQLPFFRQLQQAFGPHDLSGIRAHQGPAAAASAQAIGAKAFASGSDVVFARPPSLFTAAHEVAHIIQQQRGVCVPGGVGRRNDSYERHADQVASNVVQGKSVAGLLDGGAGAARASVTTPAASAPIQMDWEDVQLRRRAEFRPGRGRKKGFAGYFANTRLDAGTTVSVDFDTRAATYRPGFVQARRWNRGVFGLGAHWETGYIKQDAVVQFPNQDYQKGDKYFGLFDPNIPKRPGGRYGYALQIPMSDPRALG